MFVDIYTTTNKYGLIYTDPPWQQGKGGSKSVRPLSSGGELDYQVISLQEIKSIMEQSKSISNENHLLFCWTIEKYLWEAERLVIELGYKVHSRMIWDKVTGIPAAFTIRFGHEYLLYCYYGKLLPVALEQRGKWHSVLREQVKEHSQKPQIAYQMIESLYPNTNRLELFARTQRKGWDCWGNEVSDNIKTQEVMELGL